MIPVRLMDESSYDPRVNGRHELSHVLYSVLYIDRITIIGSSMAEWFPYGVELLRTIALAKVLGMSVQLNPS